MTIIWVLTIILVIYVAIAVTYMYEELLQLRYYRKVGTANIVPIKLSVFFLCNILQFMSVRDVS